MNARLTRARYCWENRRKKAAERLGRGTNEILEWKVFSDAAKVRQLDPPPPPPPCVTACSGCALHAPCSGAGQDTSVAGAPAHTASGRLLLTLNLAKMVCCHCAA